MPHYLVFVVHVHHLMLIHVLVPFHRRPENKISQFQKNMIFSRANVYHVTEKTRKRIVLKSGHGPILSPGNVEFYSLPNCFPSVYHSVFKATECNILGALKYNLNCKSIIQSFLKRKDVIGEFISGKLFTCLEICRQGVEIFSCCSRYS